MYTIFIIANSSEARSLSLTAQRIQIKHANFGCIYYKAFFFLLKFGT